MKIYKIIINNLPIDIIQDSDGKFIFPEKLKHFDLLGTALKPALEPITLARKPLEEKTIVDNVLKYGTGGINIDDSRIETDEVSSRNHKGRIYKDSIYDSDGESTTMFIKKHNWSMESKGRFPANLIHDGSDEVEEIFPDTKSGTLKPHNKTKTNNIYGVFGNDYEQQPIESSEGSASRFFKQCEKNICQEENQNPLNVNIAKNTLSPQDQVEGFVLELVAIKDSQEDNPSKNIIIPFMIEIQKVLKINSVKNIKMMMNIGQKCLHELKHTITEKLKCNHVSNVEIQKQINTMMIIQNLMNIDGFVEVVISNIMLKNMVLGEKVCRFKYCAKTSKKDRGEGNNHPTVKPTELMRYLVKLITPKGGVCLDPFMGSGSTGKACKLDDVDFIGIDLDSDYIDIARKRINETLTHKTLF